LVHGHADAVGAIDVGEFSAIVGFSGSGKTMLISAMADLVTPASGTAHRW